MDYLVIALAGSATALATGLGAIPVFMVGSRTARLNSAMWGFAAGTMTFASIIGLFLPALDQGSTVVVLAGNVPEGTSVAIPMERAGFGGWQQFWAAVATSIPQPIAAVGAFALVAAVGGLLPFSFGFAAGAMLALVAVELVPKAVAEGWRGALAGAAAGAALMLALSVVLGV